jgi:hypothetical protein
VRGRLLAALTAWKIGRLRFPQQGGREAQDRTREILDTFRRGAQAALHGASNDQLRERGAAIALHRRPFYWEGVSFGEAALDCTGYRPPSVQRVLRPHYRVMHYTGYGVWNGFACRSRLRQVPITPDHWAAVDDYVSLSPLIAGGTAFALVASAGRLDLPSLPPDLAETADAAAATAFWHGCGRALWFLCMENPVAVTRVVHPHPLVRAPLLEGVGVAIAYTNSESATAVMRWIRSFPPADRSPLLRGAGLALAALVEDDADNGPRVAAIEIEELRQASTLAGWAARQAPATSAWYSEMMHLARERSPLVVSGA